MIYCYQPWQIHILLENEMLKKVNFLKIGPCLDMPIGCQSFATMYHTYVEWGYKQKLIFFKFFKEKLFFFLFVSEF